MNRTRLTTATFALALLTSFVALPLQAEPVQAEEAEPLNVAIIWHYHQPFYRDPLTGEYLLPWVRMHSASSYWRMADIVLRYPDIHVTFNFTGSLLLQLADYIEEGVQDLREKLSLKIAAGENLTTGEKFSMFAVPGGFFDINWANIVTKRPRYNEILFKRNVAFELFGDLPQQEMMEKVTGYLAEQDYIDLAAQFNLYWIDPEFIKADLELAPLWNKISYSRENIQLIIRKQREIMENVIGIHKSLQEQEQIEVTASPYAHPMLSLLTSFGWEDDAQAHVGKGIELYERFFGTEPLGMWPSEQAVNEASLRIMAEEGILWTTTDMNILQQAGVDISAPGNLYKPYKVDLGNSELINVFFRDSHLSNQIGFAYKDRGAEEAVDDFVGYLLETQEHNVGGDMVVTIALDGENPWEGYPNNGNDFLNALYARLTELQDSGLIRTVTPGEYLDRFVVEEVVPETEQEILHLQDVDISGIERYEDLPRVRVSQAIPEGTWSGLALGHAIWVGDKQEDVAWMWLKVARDTLMEFIVAHPEPEYRPVIEEAKDALYIAQTSCWWFWYGWDAGSPATFDPLFKANLINIYQKLGEEVPAYLKASFFPDGEPSSLMLIDPPADLMLAKVDGIPEPGEWDNSALIAVDGEWIGGVQVGYNFENLFIRVNPGVDLKEHFGENLFIGVYLSSPRTGYSPFDIGYNTTTRYQVSVDNGGAGFALYSELGLWFDGLSATAQNFALSVANGSEGWSELKSLETIAINEILELSVPFDELGLEGGDETYLAVTAAYNGSLIDLTSRLDAPFAFSVPSVPEEIEFDETVFEMDDPEGDDYGSGTYVYALNEVFVPGHLDLLRFQVGRIGEDAVLVFTFKTLGGNPWRGANGFSMQYVHVYVDSDRVLGSGRTDTFGLNLEVDSASAWEYALKIGPGFEAPGTIFSPEFPEGKLGVMQIEVEETTIIARIPADVMDLEENWVYVVAVAPFDGYGPNSIRPFGVEADDWTVGGADPEAVIASVAPRVFDILVPEGMTQEEVLKGYDAEKGTFAIVYAVGATPPAPVSEWPTILVIVGVIAIVCIGVALWRKYWWGRCSIAHNV